MDYESNIEIKCEPWDDNTITIEENWMNGLEIPSPLSNKVVNEELMAEHVDNNVTEYNIKCEIDDGQIVVHKCDFCYLRFTKKSQLLCHNLTHLRVQLTHPNMFQCDHCSCFFTTKRSIITHMSIRHANVTYSNTTSKNLFRCYLCDKIYTYRHWHDHMRRVHHIGQYKCHICHITYKIKKNLLKHILKHANGMHKCRVCSKIFKTKYSLTKHRRIQHTEIVTRNKNFKPTVDIRMNPCPKCTKIFASQSALATHTKTVHTGGEFKCDKCPSVFTCFQYLRTHKQRVHYNDGERHFCTICTKNFRSPRYLNIHMKNSHKKEISSDVGAISKKLCEISEVILINDNVNYFEGVSFADDVVLNEGSLEESNGFGINKVTLSSDGNGSVSNGYSKVGNSVFEIDVTGEDKPHYYKNILYLGKSHRSILKVAESEEDNNKCPDFGINENIFKLSSDRNSTVGNGEKRHGKVGRSVLKVSEIEEDINKCPDFGINENIFKLSSDRNSTVGNGEKRHGKVGRSVLKVSEIEEDINKCPDFGINENIFKLSSDRNSTVGNGEKRHGNDGSSVFKVSEKAEDLYNSIIAGGRNVYDRWQNK